MIAGGRPDHVILQSWNRHPGRLLPETEGGTFTNLITRYLRTRTSMSLELIAGKAVGTLRTADGSPIAKAAIKLSAQPLSGSGVVTTYTVKGVVPAGARTADVGLRVNTECNCSGPVKLVLDGVRYSEGKESRNRVPNAGFAKGWDGWGASGTATYQLRGKGAAAALHLAATPNQVFGLNSGPFTVRPGAAFTATFTAVVSPASTGNGSFDIIFLDGSREVRRFTIELAAGEVIIGQVRTDAGGSFRSSLVTMPSGRFEVRAWYAGDDARWPSWQTLSR